MNIKELYLPKWPQMIVTGKSVTIDQAKDIIFKTDYFLTDCSKYAGGNNHKFNEWYKDIAGLYKLKKKDDSVKEELEALLGRVHTDYVHNDWTSCCFIYGPHGWCHPTGKIEYIDNIGKYPEPEEVLKDWVKLAEAFSYLDLNVTLMNGESCEEYPTNPVFNIRVIDGMAFVEEPNLEVHKPYANREFSGVFSNEQGLPTEWVIEYAAKVKETIMSII